MELWREIICCELQRAAGKCEFLPEICLNEIVKIRSYQALNAIKEIIENEDLDDVECFDRIEKIVRVFEELGSDGGNRHDFG